MQTSANRWHVVIQRVVHLWFMTHRGFMFTGLAQSRSILSAPRSLDAVLDVSNCAIRMMLVNRIARFAREGWNCRFQNTPRTEGWDKVPGVSAQGSWKVAIFPVPEIPEFVAFGNSGIFFPAIFPGLSRNFPPELPHKPQKQPQPSWVFWESRDLKPIRNVTQRAQRLKKSRFRSEIETFKRPISDWNFNRDWKFQARLKIRLLFWGIIKVGIEIFKRDWNFQSRLKFSILDWKFQAYGLKISRDQSRLNFFNRRALWGQKNSKASTAIRPVFGLATRIVRFEIAANQCQPAPKYHTKGCSHSSVDSPGARTLFFCSIWAISRCGLSGVNSANALWCDTLALSQCQRRRNDNINKICVLEGVGEGENLRKIVQNRCFSWEIPWQYKFGNFANFIVRNFVVIWEAPPVSFPPTSISLPKMPTVEISIGISTICDCPVCCVCVLLRTSQTGTKIHKLRVTTPGTIGKSRGPLAEPRRFTKVWTPCQCFARKWRSAFEWPPQMPLFEANFLQDLPSWEPSSPLWCCWLASSTLEPP